MKPLHSLILGLAVSLALAAHAQTPAPSEEDTVTDAAADALWWADFDELERLHTQYQQSGEHTAAGRSRLVLLRHGLNRILKGPKGARDAYFVQTEALTLQWTKAHPKSALAQVMHAMALSQHGWSYRGTGYARSVPPEAWKDFVRFNTRAIEQLANSKSVAMTSSSAHVELLDLGRSASWDYGVLWSVAQAGLAINAEDEGLYRGMLLAALPKWGGSASLVDRVIRDFAKLTDSAHGDIYYARMYAWAADWEFQHRLFSDSGADWQRMKRGYEQMLVRYPSALNVNGYAYFACLARDKLTLLNLLERIGTKPLLIHWGSNASRTFETCKRWAAES